MAEIRFTSRGVTIHGSDAFLVLRDIWEGRINVKIPSTQARETTRKEKVVNPPLLIRSRAEAQAPAPQFEVPVEGDWFKELKSLTKGKEA